MTALSDLIARLEAAKGGEAALDLMIGDFVGSSSHPPDTGGLSMAPDYTRSLDAALTLVPEGWGYNLHGSPPEHNCHQSASLMRGAAPYFDTEEIEVSAATPILALVVAALKAQEAASDLRCNRLFAPSVQVGPVSREADPAALKQGSET